MQSDSIATVHGSNETRPSVGPLDGKDLPEAERIFRVAFGTLPTHPIPQSSGGSSLRVWPPPCAARCRLWRDDKGKLSWL